MKIKEDAEMDKMTLTFKLPDYSYCFEKHSVTAGSKYSTSYFKSDTKDSKGEKEKGKFIAATTRFFSDKFGGDNDKSSNINGSQYPLSFSNSQRGPSSDSNTRSSSSSSLQNLRFSNRTSQKNQTAEDEYSHMGEDSDD